MTLTIWHVIGILATLAVIVGQFRIASCKSCFSIVGVLTVSS